MMSRFLVASGPGFFGSLGILQLLAGRGEDRTVEESQTRGADEADRDHSAETLDATAGSEFVDDRIRLRE
jgi:hypothetical protein